MNEPSVGDTVRIRVDLNIGAGFILCPVHIQQRAGLLIDDLVAAVVLMFKLPNLSRGRIFAEDNDISVGHRQVHALRGTDLGVEVGTDIQRFRQNRAHLDLVDLETLGVRTVEHVGLHIGKIRRAIAGHIQHTGLRAGRPEHILISGFIDEPSLGNVIMVLENLNIGAGDCCCPVHIQQHTGFLVDDLIASVVLTYKLPDLSGCGTVAIDDDVLVRQGQILALRSVDLCVEIRSEIHLGQVADTRELVNGKLLGAAAVICICPDIGHGGGTARVHIQHAVRSGHGTEDISSICTLIDVPKLSSAVLVFRDGDIRLRFIAIHRQRITVLGIDNTIRTAGMTFKCPDLCRLIAGCVGDHICIRQREVQFCGGITDPGLEVVAEIQGLGSHTGLIDTRAYKMLHCGNIVGSVGFFYIVIVRNIVFDVKNRACRMTFLDTVITEVLEQRLFIISILCFDRGIFGAVILRIKYHIFGASGQPVLAGCCGSGSGILVCGAANINDICIADGIRFLTNSTTVGRNRRRAGVALDGVNRTVGIAGYDTDMVGDIAVAAGFEIDNVTCLGSIAALSDSSAGIGSASADKPVQAGGSVGVTGNNGGGNTRHICTPGDKHGTPLVLHTVPASILRIVTGAFDCAGKFGGRSAFLISNLGFCHIDNVHSLISGQLHVGKPCVILTGLIGGGTAVAQSGCLRKSQRGDHQHRKTERKDSANHAGHKISLLVYRLETI